LTAIEEKVEAQKTSPVAACAAGICLLYGLSLGAITMDEIFRLGWFPTELEKQVQGNINLAASSDQEERAIALKALETSPGFVLVPSLIRELEAEQLERRITAARLLSHRTHEYLNGNLFGYSPDSPLKRRKQAIQNLWDWWTMVEEDY
jgi:hypothetical protein